MTALLDNIEIHCYRILGVESEWFSQQIYQVKKWHKENPKKSVLIVSGSTGACATSLGCLSRHGIHLFYLAHIASVPLSVAASVVVGDGIGLVIGCLILLGCHFAFTKSETVVDQAAEQAETIQRMVNAIGGLPSSQFQQELQTLIGEHDKMKSTLQAFEDFKDRKCFFCLGEGSEVKYP